MADASIFDVKTPLGTSRSGHGISTRYNRENLTKAAKQARETRRLARRQSRAAWSNDSRATGTPDSSYNSSQK